MPVKKLSQSKLSRLARSKTPLKRSGIASRDYSLLKALRGRFAGKKITRAQSRELQDWKRSRGRYKPQKRTRSFAATKGKVRSAQLSRAKGDRAYKRASQVRLDIARRYDVDTSNVYVYLLAKRGMNRRMTLGAFGDFMTEEKYDADRRRVFQEYRVGVAREDRRGLPVMSSFVDVR